jgi:hypothetical protein
MKPFGVAGYRADAMMDARYASVRVPGGVNLMYHEPPAVWNDNNHVSDQIRVYFTDTKTDADSLALTLATQYPNRCWVVFASTHAYESKPGAPTKSEFNEKGFVPA